MGDFTGTQAPDEEYQDMFDEMFGDGNSPEKSEDAEESEEVEVKEEAENPPEEQESTSTDEEGTEAEEDEDSSDATGEKEPEPTQGKPKKKDDEEDPLDKYARLVETAEDPEVKEAAQQILHRARTWRGQVSALGRKVDGLEHYFKQQKLQSGSAAKPSGSRRDSASSASTKGTEEKKESPKVEALKKQYPNLTDAIQEYSDTIHSANKSEIEKLREEVLQPLQEMREQQYMETERERLTKLADDLFDFEETGLSLDQILNSQEFSEWRNEQSPRIREMMEKSNDADTAYLVLQKFDSDMRHKYAADSESTEEEDAPAHNKGDELKRKREEKKSKAKTPTSKARPGGGAQASLSHDQLFDQMWGESGTHRTKR